ncbi:hypothetical protein VPH35_060762 [Triticum aestivum]
MLLPQKLFCASIYFWDLYLVATILILVCYFCANVDFIICFTVRPKLCFLFHFLFTDSPPHSMECSVSILVLPFPMHGYTIQTASDRVPVNPDETRVVDKMIAAPIIGR